MKRLRLILLGALLVAPLVFAVDGKLFTWIPPTEREDATPLPESEIASYNIYCDGDPAPVFTQSHIPSGNQTWQSHRTDFALGVHSCHATTVDTGGLESDPSNIVNFTVTPERPLPPVFAVQ